MQDIKFIKTRANKQIVLKAISIFTLISLMIFSSSLSAKANSELESLFGEIINSKAYQRTRLISKLNKFKHKEVVNHTKKHLNSSDIKAKEAAAEVSGIIKDKSYEKIIKSNLKTAKDFELINSLIFSIGENRYHKSGKLLCKYLKDKKHTKTVYFALIKLADNSCYSKFNKTLNNRKSDKDKLAVLELITKTKNKKYLRTLKKLFKRTKNSTVKHSTAIALLVLADKTPIKFIKNYLNKELDSNYLKLKAYKQLEKLLTEDNRNMETIFLNGLEDKEVYVKLYAISILVKKNKYHKLSQEDLDFIESYSKSEDPNIFITYSNYKRYLHIHNKNKPKKLIIKDDNELAQPK